MAESEKLPPTPRTPLPDGSSRGATRNMEAPPPKIKPATQESQQSQIPAIQESRHSQATAFKGSQSQDIQVPSTPKSGQKQAQPHLNRDEDLPIDDRTDTGEGEDKVDPDSELLPIDWDEFDARYARAMNEANEVEDALYADFDRLCGAFGTWAQTSCQLDNERGSKRVKTRQRYLQISEDKLDEKKKHYTQVIEAFKKALELLGN